MENAAGAHARPKQDVSSPAIRFAGPCWPGGGRGMSQHGKEGRRRASLAHLVKVVCTLKDIVTVLSLPAQVISGDILL